MTTTRQFSVSMPAAFSPSAVFHRALVRWYDRDRVHEQVVLEVFLRLCAVSGDLVVDLVEADRVLCRLEIADLHLAEHACRRLGHEFW